jgi:predicted Zn-ribbon and HTH transcriptional regulator
MTQPYRHLSPVPPLVVVPTTKEMLRAVGATPFEEIEEYRARCPKCKTRRSDGILFVLPPAEGPVLVGKICVGWRSRWWSFRPACDCRAEHFHVRCRTCKARWIMEPADVRP